MRAVLINKAGFHKRINVAKKVASFRQVHPDSMNLVSLDEIDDTRFHLPIIEFDFDREYIDEWGETILIYKEYGS